MVHKESYNLCFLFFSSTTFKRPWQKYILLCSSVYFSFASLLSLCFAYGLQTAKEILRSFCHHLTWLKEVKLQMDHPLRFCHCKRKQRYLMIQLHSKGISIALCHHLIWWTEVQLQLHPPLWLCQGKESTRYWTIQPHLIGISTLNILCAIFLCFFPK